MVLQKIKSKLKTLLSKELAQALLLGFIIMVPAYIYLTATNKRVTSIHILPGCCGWTWVEAMPKENLTLSDTIDYFLPTNEYTERSLKAGDVPVWNHYIFGGEAHLGNVQSAVFSPVRLFAVAGLSSAAAMTASVLFSIQLAISGFYYFFRKSKLEFTPSLLGSLLFVSSIPFLYYSHLGTIPWIIALLPFVLALLKPNKISWRNSVGAALLIGLMFYFGHFQYVLSVGFIIGMMALYRLQQTKNKKDYLKKLLVIPVASLFIAAPVLLPALEQISHGHRADSDKIMGSGFDAIISEVKNWFIEDPVTEGQEYYSGEGRPRLDPPVGAVYLVVGFAVMALTLKTKTITRTNTQKHNDLAKIGLLITIGGLMLAWRIPPFNILLNGFGLQTFSRSNFYYISIFGLCVLAAFTAQRLIRIKAKAQPAIKKIDKHYIVFALLMIVAWLVALLSYSDGYSRLYPYISIFAVAASLALHKIATTHGKALKVTLYALVTLILSVPVYVNFLSFTGLNSQKVRDAGNPLLSYLQTQETVDDNFVRVVSPYSPNSNLYYQGVSIINGYDSLYRLKTKELIRAINFPQQTRNSANENAIYVNNLEKHNVLLNLGVEYVISRETPSLNTELVAINAVDGKGLYKLTDSIGPIYFPSSVISLGAEQHLELIEQDALKLREVAIDGPGSAGGGKITDYQYKTNSIDIELNAYEEDSVVFIATTYDDDWTIAEGNAAGPYTADYNYMYIIVPAGEQKITLKFEQRSYRLGLLTGFTSIIIIAAVVLVVPRLNKVKKPKRKTQ